MFQLKKYTLLNNNILPFRKSKIKNNKQLLLYKKINI